MSTLENYRPRLIFEITHEQQKRVNIHLGTYGLKKAVMSIILDSLLDLIEQHGQIVIGIILDQAANPEKVLPALKAVNSKLEIINGKSK